MKMRTLVGLCLFSFCVLVSATEKSGAPSPTENPNHRSHRGPRSVLLDIETGAEIVLWKPNLTTMPVQVKERKVRLPSTGMDNYHALVATRRKGHLVETAIRYVYLWGKPSGHSPRELLAQKKSDLEIVPNPLPREHYHYFSGQKWPFLVRFQGKPLRGERVHLKTANGSQLESTTDDKGLVVFELPDDFPNVQEGRRDRRNAEFELWVSHGIGNIEYRTTLNASYKVNPKHWHSTGWGVLFACAGFFVGGLLGMATNRNNPLQRNLK